MQWSGDSHQLSAPHAQHWALGSVLWGAACPLQFPAPGPWEEAVARGTLLPAPSKFSDQPRTPHCHCTPGRALPITAGLVPLSPPRTLSCTQGTETALGEGTGQESPLSSFLWLSEALGSQGDGQKDQSQLERPSDMAAPGDGMVKGRAGLSDGPRRAGEQPCTSQGEKGCLCVEGVTPNPSQRGQSYTPERRAGCGASVTCRAHAKAGHRQ